MSQSNSYMDWNAAAAWIALVISIVGTIATPIITSFLNNRHQLKMYRLKSKERSKIRLQTTREAIIHAFTANTGKVISVSSLDIIAEFGAAYFPVYQYVPEQYWDKLDELYAYIMDNDWKKARVLYPEIMHAINGLLKESPL